MGPVGEPAAEGERRNVDRVDAEELECHDRAGDVDDGIHGSDVVEVDLVARRAVGARLGLGQPREDPRGLRADRGGEPAPLEDRQDVTERAVVLVRAGVDIDVHLGGTESRLPHLARDELPSLERELLELASQRIEWGARIDDIVHTLLQSAGTGQLQIVGANDQILINSRTYTPSSSGTYGQFVPSAVASESVGAGDLPLSIPGLENTSAFRSNIGFAEVAGMAGEIRVRFYDAAGHAVADQVYGIAPFGHVHTRVNPSGEALRA